MFRRLDGVEGFSRLVPATVFFASSQPASVISGRATSFAVVFSRPAPLRKKFQPRRVFSQPHSPAERSKAGSAAAVRSAIRATTPPIPPAHTGTPSAPAHVSDQTVGNILKRHGLGIAPERKRNLTWAEFIRRHKQLLWATDFFTAEVWTSSGLTTFYVLFFIHLQTRKVVLGGVTRYPQQEWLRQVARNLTVTDGPLSNARFLLHDRDTKFSDSFDGLLQDAGVTAIKLPPQSPNLNAFAERCGISDFIATGGFLKTVAVRLGAFIYLYIYIFEILSCQPIWAISPAL